MTTPDPRHPMAFDVRVLGRRAGAKVEVPRSIPIEDDHGTEIIAVRAGSDLDVVLRMESVLEGVLASGTVRAVADGVCVRCLEPVQEPVEATFQELFAYGDRAAHHHDVGAPDDEEEHTLVGDLLDLEPVLRDAVVTALPFKPVCSPDCLGLCVECGTTLSDHPGHRHETIDPRWAALAGLASDSEEKRN